MQEEVENRTVNLAVSTGRLTVRVLLQAILKYLDHSHRNKEVKKDVKRQVRTGRRIEEEKIRVRQEAEAPKGKQSVKQLLKSGKEVRRLPVQTEQMREFRKVIQKYGVDFAITKGIYEGKPRYIVFFKAKDEKLLDAVYKECIEKQLHLDKKEKRPSLLKTLALSREMAEKVPHKPKQIQKELTR